MHGGGAFLLLYLACVLVMGIPVIVAEFLIGRATRRNVRGTLRQIAPGTGAHHFAYVCILASLTSTISMSEISIAFFNEEYKMSRDKASLLNTVIAVVFGSLCALSFGPLAHVTVFGMTLFDLFDYVSSNILLPLGGLFFSVLVGWYLDRRLVEAELSNHDTRRVRLVRPLVFCLRYVAPVAILLVFLYGLGVVRL